jgi:hypothetical protein
MGQGKRGSVFDSRFVISQESLNEGLLVSKTSQQGEIDINGFARLAPAQQGEPADDAETPPVPLAESLKLGGRTDDFNHGVWLS